MIVYDGASKGILKDMKASVGELLPLLREERFPLVHRLAHRRLFGVHGPCVTFGLDLGREIIRVERAYDTSMRALETEALGNLARRGFTPVLSDDGMVSVFDEYAPEAILLPSI